MLNILLKGSYNNFDFLKRIITKDCSYNINWEIVSEKNNNGKFEISLITKARIVNVLANIGFIVDCCFDSGSKISISIDGRPVTFIFYKDENYDPTRDEFSQDELGLKFSWKNKIYSVKYLSWMFGDTKFICRRLNDSIRNEIPEEIEEKTIDKNKTDTEEDKRTLEDNKSVEEEEKNSNTIKNLSNEIFTRDELLDLYGPVDSVVLANLFNTFIELEELYSRPTLLEDKEFIENRLFQIINLIISIEPDFINGKFEKFLSMSFLKENGLKIIQ